YKFIFFTSSLQDKIDNVDENAKLFNDKMIEANVFMTDLNQQKSSNSFYKNCIITAQLIAIFIIAML
ncbi:MAG: hypothetical protein MHMPM18_002724, partial [Marteilia pararefringens]